MCLLNTVVHGTDTVVSVPMNITCRKGRHLVKYSIVKKCNEKQRRVLGWSCAMGTLSKGPGICSKLGQAPQEVLCKLRAIK